MSRVLQLACCLTSVSVMKPSDSEGKVPGGVWSRCSSFALHLDLPQLWTLGELETQVITLPPSPLPGKFGVNPTADHAVLKSVLWSRVCSSSFPILTAHQSPHRSLVTIETWIRYLWDEAQGSVCLTNASDDSVRKQFVGVLKGE